MRTAHYLGVIVLCVTSASSIGAQSDTSRQSTLLTALSGVTLSGYAEASYSASSSAVSVGDESASRRIAGRLYDRYDDQFTLNALKLVLDKPFDISKWDAGFHADILFGQNASVVQSAGFSLGPQGDMTQLYITLNAPTSDGNGVQIKIGKLASLMGLEVIEDVANPNWSEGSQFIYLENFTGTGISVERKFNRYVDAQLRLMNGWDVVQDNNSGKSIMARVGLYPDSSSSIAVVGFYGPEEAGLSAIRSGFEVLANRKLASSLNVWIQGDVGRERKNPLLPDPSRDAKWSAIGAWLAYDLTSAAGLALRGDYVNDADGARTSGVLAFPANTGQRFGSITGTLNLRAWPHTLVRPEVRWDRSTIAAFGGRNDQTSVALSFAFIY